MIFVLFACADSVQTEKETSDSALISTDWNEEKSLEHIQEISNNICEQLSSCCSPVSQEIYFSSYMNNTNLSEFHAQLPPNEILSQDQCETTLANMLEKVWLGSWMDAVEREEAIFLPEQYDQCMLQLQNSTCGEELTSALFDGTCFGYNAPSGGTMQRSFFQRAQQIEESCTPLSDGFGGLYYGTCDESESYCCVPSELGCSPYPIPDVQGTCVQASKEGDSCSTQEPIQLCASGLTCSIDTKTCTAQSTELLQEGDSCYNPNTYELTGTCIDSWCDLFESAQCEPLIENGDECLYGESCLSGVCDTEMSICVESTFCDAE